MRACAPAGAERKRTMNSSSMHRIATPFPMPPISCPNATSAPKAPLRNKLAVPAAAKPQGLAWMSEEQSSCCTVCSDSERLTKFPRATASAPSNLPL